MTKQEFVDSHKQICENIHNKCLKKNSDYSGNSDDPFKGWKGGEFYGTHGALIALWSRHLEKCGRIAGFINNGTLQVNESVVTTMLDDANILILMAMYVEEQQTEVENGE